jgi:N-acetyl-anhydromuramyl-L-alanine amidase AmpD
MPDGRGWMPGVEHIPTPTYGYTDVSPGTMKPVAVVNHIMAGYQRTMISWAELGNGQVSAHFTIGRTGRIVQHVSVYDPAYHAGRLDRDGKDRPVQPTWPRYRPGSNPNKYTVGIEHEGFSTVPNYGYDYLYDDAHPWPDEMIEASIDVHRWILGELGLQPNDLTVIGHNEIAPLSRAQDPGKQWPRRRLISALMASGPAEPSGPTELEPLSPPLAMQHAVRLMVDAFIPHYLAKTKTRITPLPMRAGKHIYELEVEEKE